MSEPSEKDLLEFLDGHKPIGKNNPDHVCFDAICRLIEKVGEWQGRAKTNLIFWPNLDYGIQHFLTEIRDFGEEEK